MSAFTVRRVEAFVFRCPIAVPVVTSFGTMRDRPMVLVRVEDDQGVVGWGEAWCNFPSVGAEHRARLVESVMAPLLQGQRFDSPEAAFKRLTEATAVLAIQSGERGPVSQAIAALDIAMWDGAARRAGVPLWRMLGGASPSVRVYASGLNPDGAVEVALARRAEGYAAFKLKIGFGAARDIANLRALRGALGRDTPLMVDANQGWTLDQALETVASFAEFGLDWLEEPLRADRPWREWQELQRSTKIPLAAGENFADDAAFTTALDVGALRVIQPDMAKWGGFTGCAPVARGILVAGQRFCPHFLGGGIGLLASAHLLAGIGGDGLLEVDANPNPLRSLTCGPVDRIVGGTTTLEERPGLGVDIELEALQEYAVAVHA